MIDERIKRQMQSALPKTISYFEKGKMVELKRRLLFNEYGATVHYTGNVENIGTSRAAKTRALIMQEEYIFFEDNDAVRLVGSWPSIRANGFSVTYSLDCADKQFKQ